MSHVIHTNIERPSRELVDKLGALGTATIHEAMGRTGLMRPYLRPIYSAAHVAGTAVTVLSHPGDNLMIHAAIEVCQPGDVLVVAVTSESTDGMFGELLAVSGQAHGVKGLVIDAGVRDTSVLTEMQFPVWAKQISAQGTVKATAGSVNVAVVCGGTVVNPGDVIVADQDGVVCIPRDRMEEVLRLGEAREQRESMTRERLQRGELGVDIYSLRSKLEQLGVQYVDAPKGTN